MDSMSRPFSLNAVLVAGAVQATVAQSAPEAEPAAQKPDAARATWVARFPDEPEPDATLPGVPTSSNARFGSGLDSDGPGCASSGLAASAGTSNQQVALARSVLLRFGSGLEGDVPTCAAEVGEASAKTPCLRFGSGLEDDARVRAPNMLLESGLEGLASKATPSRAAPADRFGSGLEDSGLENHPQVPAPKVLQESGL